MKETETIALLEKLAEKLGVTAGKLWEVLVAYAPIQAAANLVLMASCLGFTAWLSRKAINYRGDEDMKFVLILAMGLCCFICLVVISLLISSTVSGFFVPEYWALNRIMEAIQ